MPISQQETINLQCPACGQPFEAALWLIVDTKERSDLLQAIKDESLNQHNCPHCQSLGSIDAPLLVHHPEQQLMILALPPSVQTPEEAQEIADQLVGMFHQAILEQKQPLESYQFQVDLAADLADIRSMVQNDATETELQIALEAILATDSPQAFEQTLAKYRRVLMSEQVDPILHNLVTQAIADGHPELARHISDQQASLEQFRATWLARSVALDDFMHTNDVDPTLEPTLHAIAHAVDPQEVYAARLKLTPDQQTLLDAQIDRLVEQASQSNQSLLPFLQEIQRMQRQ